MIADRRTQLELNGKKHLVQMVARIFAADIAADNSTERTDAEIGQVFEVMGTSELEIRVQELPISGRALIRPIPGMEIKLRA